jgi:hypothetical protein
MQKTKCNVFQGLNISLTELWLDDKNNTKMHGEQHG